jgi:hypothetical protein
LRGFSDHGSLGGHRGGTFGTKNRIQLVLQSIDLLFEVGRGSALLWR